MPKKRDEAYATHKNIKVTSENLNYLKSPKGKRSLEKQSPAAQFKTDASIWHAYLAQSENIGPLTKERIAIMKRLFSVLSDGDLQFKNLDAKTFTSIKTANDKLADEEKMPLASILSHGGRVLIQVPPIKEDGDPDAFLKWVLGGELGDKISPLRKKSNEADKAVMQRSAATHSLAYNEKTGMIEEQHIRITNIKGHVANFGKHFGMNVGLGTIDTAGPDDGSYGHLYIKWEPPSHDRPGGLLIGCEGSEPGKKNQLGDKHDAMAKIPKFSPTFGQKFNALRHPIKPHRTGGLRIDLSNDTFEKLITQPENNFDLTLLGQPVGSHLVTKPDENEIKKPSWTGDDTLKSQLREIVTEFNKRSIFQSKDRIIDATVLDYLITHATSSEDFQEQIAEYFSQVKTAGEITGGPEKRIKDHRYQNRGNDTIEEKVKHALDVHNKQILQDISKKASPEQHKKMLITCIKIAKDRYFALHPELSEKETISLSNNLSMMTGMLYDNLEIFNNTNLQKKTFTEIISHLCSDGNNEFSKKLPGKLRQFLLDEFSKYQNNQILLNESYGTIEVKFSDEKHDSREFQIKTWTPSLVVEGPKKIIIAIHGWGDSVDTWNNVGQEAIQHGYTVVAYDQRGFGYDKERTNTELHPDQLCIDLKKIIEYQLENNPKGTEIVLMGHSMGGSLLLNEKIIDFINGTRQIKGAVCLAPAISENLVPNMITGPNSLEGDSEQLKKQKNNPRYSNLFKKMSTLVGLTKVMRKASDGLSNLIQKNIPSDKPFHIFYGQLDSAVNSKYFDNAEKKNMQNIDLDSRPTVTFHELSRGSHLLTMLPKTQDVTHLFIEKVDEIFSGNTSGLKKTVIDDQKIAFEKQIRKRFGAIKNLLENTKGEIDDKTLIKINEILLGEKNPESIKNWNESKKVYFLVTLLNIKMEQASEKPTPNTPNISNLMDQLDKNPNLTLLELTKVSDEITSDRPEQPNSYFTLKKDFYSQIQSLCGQLQLNNNLELTDQSTRPGIDPVQPQIPMPTDIRKKDEISSYEEDIKTSVAQLNQFAKEIEAIDQRLLEIQDMIKKYGEGLKRSNETISLTHNPIPRQ